MHSLGAGSQGDRCRRRSSRASHDAFIHAFANGMWLSAGVAALGAVLAFWLIAPKTRRAPRPGARPEAAAAEAVWET